MASRRTMLIALGFTVVSIAMPSRAQQSKVWRIGFLGARSRSDLNYEAFVQGLRELGYVEGKNIVIEWRLAEGNYDRLPALAAELVKLKPDVIVTHGTPPSQTMQRATSTIPIVAVSVTDPVRAGLVKSLARSGNNVTGVSNITVDVTPKQVELLKNLIPALSRVGVFVNPGNSAHAEILGTIRGAAQQLGIRIVPAEAGSAQEIGRAFATLARENTQAAIVASDSFLFAQGARIADQALKHKIGLMSPFREHTALGALISYGPSQLDVYRRGATYVDRILRGAKPSELPIEQPTTVELVINLRTARSLGITISQELRLRAAAVIE